MTLISSIIWVTKSQFSVCSDSFIYQKKKKKNVLSLKERQSKKWYKGLKSEMALPCGCWPPAFNLLFLRDCWVIEGERGGRGREKERRRLSPTKRQWIFFYLDEYWKLQLLVTEHCSERFAIYNFGSSTKWMHCWSIQFFLFMWLYTCSSQSLEICNEWENHERTSGIIVK